MQHKANGKASMKDFVRYFLIAPRFSAKTSYSFLFAVSISLRNQPAVISFQVPDLKTCQSFTSSTVSHRDFIR